MGQSQPGPLGPQGLKGDQGDIGAPSTVPGPQGPQGPQGDKGETGAPSTVPGPQGLKGDKGDKGDKGEPGAPSTVAGPQGATGLTGPSGVAGSAGQTGAAGAPGIQGPRGETGLTGPIGLPGAQGERGLQGLQGLQGPRGADGEVTLATFNARLQSNSMWCADGTCKPPGTSGGVNITQNWKNTANPTTSEISNDISQYKSLMVVGNSSKGTGFRHVSIYDDLVVARNQTVDGNLTVKGNSGIVGELTISGGQIVNRDSTISGNSTITGNQTVNGAMTTTKSINAIGNITASGTIFANKVCLPGSTTGSMTCIHLDGTNGPRITTARGHTFTLQNDGNVALFGTTGSLVWAGPVPSNIDSVNGWQGPHDNPLLTNQSEESCRQLALADPKYVAYGYRTPAQADPNWRNTCFLYTSGFGPFAGAPTDVLFKTGCLRPGEKVAWGCKTTPPVLPPPPNPFFR